MTHCWFDSPCSGTGSSCASTCGRISGFLIAALLLVSAPANADDHPGAGDSWLARYQGRPFSDGTIVGPAVIPGQVKCAYYDLGGEGIAYHDADGVNHGSGMLNPVNGDPLHEFRMHEGVDISYTKSGGIDDNPFDRYQPPMRSLYVRQGPIRWTSHTRRTAKGESAWRWMARSLSRSFGCLRRTIGRNRSPGDSGTTGLF
jgi:hypothetical protein